MVETATKPTVDIKSIVKGIVESIEREREREVIARRFGLYDRRETLEQIGELLGITRERVRQLEKAILARLQSQADKLPKLNTAAVAVVDILTEKGGVARTQLLAEELLGANDEQGKAHVAFIATLAPELDIVDENDDYHHGVAVHSLGADKVRSHVDDLVGTVKTHGKPVTIDELSAQVEHDSPSYVESVASLSKNLTSLKKQWGLTRWPTVNPKNIRDKIYVILSETQKPMHFSEIAEAIKESDFKRKNVTVQAIHNELIKDKRFVLIGRGIYALDEWGYKKGTVADIISEILKGSKDPLHRDDIVKRVLQKRQVKETTILLNLQGKPQFRRVAKATYALAE